YACATAYYDESLALYTELGDKHQIALVRCSLAYLAHQHGDDMQAAALLMDNLRLCCDHTFQDGIAGCLLGFSWVSVARGQSERAARLLGAAMQARPVQAARLLGALPSPTEIASALIGPFNHPAFEHNLATVRAQLDEATFAAAWAEGCEMMLEQAIAYALEDTTSPST
ncbi:MAG TPA: hypothetical protein VFU22_17935, partial [Roseiflexaceae bacterium]|nr:hypothetical protein [Roseiflexaceae bacterium]